MEKWALIHVSVKTAFDVWVEDFLNFVVFTVVVLTWLLLVVVEGGKTVVDERTGKTLKKKDKKTGRFADGTTLANIYSLD